ncbi:unnamed protein product, partial [Cladocopium goreaui]
ATVQSAALPDEWASRAWAGELCPTRQQAEQSAAEQALKDIKEDAELMEKAHRPGKPGGKGQKTSGGGGGGNKGYWGQMMQMMQTFLQEGGEVMFREQVTSDFVTGTVLEWKGKFGWIKPDAPVDHEFSTWRDGKVWVSLKDLSGQAMLYTYRYLHTFNYTEYLCKILLVWQARQFSLSEEVNQHPIVNAKQTLYLHA